MDGAQAVSRPAPFEFRRRRDPGPGSRSLNFPRASISICLLVDIVTVWQWGCLERLRLRKVVSPCCGTVCRRDGGWTGPAAEQSSVVRVSVAAWAVSDPGGDRAEFAVEVALQVTPLQLEQKLGGRLGRLGAQGATPPVLVVAPYLSQRSRQVLGGLGVGWVDLTGNVSVSSVRPGLFVCTDGAQRDPAPRGAAGPGDRGDRGRLVGARVGGHHPAVRVELCL